MLLAVIDLGDTYRQLARPWTPEDLAAHYDRARQHGRRRRAPRPEDARPIHQLTQAIPPAATLSTTIHMLHALPKPVDRDLPEQLLKLARRNLADALHACEHALESDAAERGYNAAEWLPTVYDIAGPLLHSAHLNTEPPALVRIAQEAISWLSRAITELDEDSDEAPASLAETLARLLAVWTFTDAALRDQHPAQAR
jgi:hypothetical protein